MAAEQEVRTAVDLFGQLGYPAGEATALTVLSTVLRDLGRHEEAIAAAVRAAEHFAASGYRLHELTALVNVGWGHLEAGRSGVARRLFVRIRDAFPDVATAVEAVLLDAGEAIAAAREGRAAEAARCAERVLERAGDAPLAEVRGWALYAAGIVGRDPARLEESVETWRSLRRPAWLARALEALADLREPPLSDVLAEEAERIRRQLRGQDA